MHLLNRFRTILDLSNLSESFQIFSQDIRIIDYPDPPRAPEEDVSTKNKFRNYKKKSIKKYFEPSMCSPNILCKNIRSDTKDAKSQYDFVGHDFAIIIAK